MLAIGILARKMCLAYDLKLHSLAIQLDCSDFLCENVSVVFRIPGAGNGGGGLTKSTPIVEI